MTRSVELPESVFAELERAAKSTGTTPAGWIKAHLRIRGAIENGHDVSDEDLAAADAALDECVISAGHALGTDNEQIDADLAREYGDDHADLYPFSNK